jgi:hypothetical protein
MDFEQLKLADRIGGSSLRAAAAIDSIHRGLSNDVDPIMEFVRHLESGTGTVLTTVRAAVAARDGEFLRRMRCMSLDIHEMLDPYRHIGPFSCDDFDALLATSKPLSANLIARIGALVGEVDIDTPADQDGGPGGGSVDRTPYGGMRPL